MSDQRPAALMAQGSVIGSEDEINLTDLFRNIWRQRGLVVGTTLLMLLAVLSFHFYKASFNVPRQVEYAVSLTFLDASGKYPNGTVFSPNDIISNSVVKATAETMSLSQPVDNINKALGVRFSNSLMEASERKLSDLLTNAKTPADMRTSAEQVLTEMRLKGRTFLTVSLNLNDAGMTSLEGAEFLSQLVSVWAQRSIDRGLTNADIERPMTPFVAPDSLNLIDAYDNAANYLDSLGKAVKRLASMSGTASMIVDGRTLEDVRREIKMLDDTDVGPLREFAYSTSAQLADQDAAIQVRLFSRQRLLNLEYDRLSKLIDSYDSALAQLNQSPVRDVARSGQSASQMGGAQFDQSFLDSLLELGNKLGGVEMRQELFERRTKAVEDRLNLEKELAILKGSNGNTYKTLNPEVILREAMQGITTELNRLQQQLDAFVVAYRVQTLQSGGRLFVADSAPVVRGGSVQLGTRIGLHAALGIVLGGMLGMMLALLRAAMVSSRQKTA